MRRAVALLALFGAPSGCAAPQSDAYAPVPEGEGWRRTRDDWVEPVGLDSPYSWDEFGALHFGERNLDGSFLPDGQGQFALGLELWGHPPGAWIDLEFGFWASAPWNGSLDDWGDAIDGFPDEESDPDDPGVEFVEGSSTLEFSAGLRKEFWLFGGHLRPFLAGGVSALRARVFAAQGSDGADDADGALGLYAQAGLGWMFLNGSRIGFSYRVLESEEVTLDGRVGDVDYEQWTFHLGFAF